MNSYKSINVMDYLIAEANKVLSVLIGETTENAWRVVQTDTSPSFPSVIFRVVAERRSGAIRKIAAPVAYQYAMVACALDYNTVARLDGMLVEHFSNDHRVLASADVEDTFEKLDHYILQRVRLITVT